MKVLVIGAGAVGQVYGRLLSKGGAEVSFFVKEKYATKIGSGLTLYPLNKKNARKNPVHWNQYGVFTQVSDVAKQKWDQVYFTMSSTALRGPWLDELAPAVGDATIVMLQQGASDLEYLRTKLRAEQIVEGVITVISYDSTSLDEKVPEPGICYFFPPLFRGPFSGMRAAAIVAALNAGGIASKRVKDIGREKGVTNSAFSILFCMINAGGWDLDKISRSRELLKLAHRAGTQATRAMAGKVGVNPRATLPLLMFTPLGMKVFLYVARAVLPFDVEKYLAVHFTKVGDQMRFGLETYASIADYQGLPNDAILELRRRMDVF